MLLSRSPCFLSTFVSPSNSSWPLQSLGHLWSSRSLDRCCWSLEHLGCNWCHSLCRMGLAAWRLGLDSKVMSSYTSSPGLANATWLIAVRVRLEVKYTRHNESWIMHTVFFTHQRKMIGAYDSKWGTLYYKRRLLLGSWTIQSNLGRASLIWKKLARWSFCRLRWISLFSHHDGCRQREPSDHLGWVAKAV